MKDTRKGFTLVELLIAMVVIGVLSAMMMFSSTEAVSSAKASNIIANLTAFKKALTHWYLDNTDKVYKKDGKYILRDIKDKNGKSNTINNLGDLLKNYPEIVTTYISNSSQFKFDNAPYWTQAKDGTYRFEDNGGVNNRTAWFVGYRLTDAEKSSGVAEKLAGRAKSLELLANQGTTGEKDSTGKNKTEITPYAGGDVVWLQVLSFE